MNHLDPVAERLRQAGDDVLVDLEGEHPVVVAVPVPFGILRRMKEQGKTVIIITHKLEEVLAISDEVTVMRDGKVVGNVKTAETDAKGLARMIVGADLTECKLTPREPGEVRLELRGFSKTSWDPFGTSLRALTDSPRSRRRSASQNTSTPAMVRAPVTPSCAAR